MSLATAKCDFTSGSFSEVEKQVGTNDNSVAMHGLRHFISTNLVHNNLDGRGLLPRWPIIRTQLLALMCGTVLLVGCKANVTYRFDVHPDKTVTVSVNEKLDDQLYTMAASQSKNADPFRLESAKSAGWTVTTAVDDDGNHLNTLTKTVPMDSLKNAIASSAPALSTVSAPLAFDPAQMSSTTGLFTDRTTLNLTIPAPSGKREGRENDPLAGAGAELAASMLSVHVELKTPGKIIATNGARTPDGAIRWTLNLQGPTKIEYTAETLDVPHLLLGVATLVAVLLSVALSFRRRGHERLAMRLSE